MSSKRKRQALYGYAPSTNALQTTTCKDTISGTEYEIPAGATYNNGGPMKFGLYPTVGVSVGFLNLLSNCCANNQKGGITTNFLGCSTA